MAQNVNPTFVKTPNFGAAIVSTGTSAGADVSIYVGGANGSKIPSLIATGIGTTAAFDARIRVSSGGGAGYWVGAATVPANAGLTGSIPGVNVFAVMPGLSVDSDGNPFIFLPSSAYSLVVSVNANSSQWVAGAVMNLIASSVGDF